MSSLQNDPFSSQRSLVSPEFSINDLRFLDALKKIGFMLELTTSTLKSYKHIIDVKNKREKRRLDLLQTYYETDESSNLSKKSEDRFFMYQNSEQLTADQILKKVYALTPQIPSEPVFERIGERNGPLVIHCNGHICSVSDEDSETKDSISVQAIVRSINALLSHLHVFHRWNLLICDGRREAFIYTSKEDAIYLFHQGFLEVHILEELLEFAKWNKRR